MFVENRQAGRWLGDFLPLLLWMGLIFWLSSRPTLIAIEHELWQKLFYKSAHVFTYAVLCWLWWRALSARRETGWHVLLAAVLLAGLYGVSDEIHQLYVPGRHGQAADVLFDLSGALAAVLLVRRWPWLRSV
ncbi:MAG: hypothetical protein D6784_08775 [Chloroflexi bacterium]|nr:MAG: hypothetical protein D6784_08775 [Chloroflexota bacterium]